MTPANPAYIHLLRFTGINENNIVGGGMDPVASDIGLWVMGAGRLQLQGADKTSWTNAAGAITAGATVNVNDAAGWLPGDSVIITATADGATNYDTRSIKAISGNTIALSTAATVHPVINNQWTAEVGNLTRNVRIEGTATGKSHVFIRSTQPQVIKNVQFRYLGPRKDQDKDKISDLILGRYGIHFHHCDDGSDGSVVIGCVMRDIGNHAYVPHVSNGIEMRDNIALNCTETPFWWDLNETSHRTNWVHNLVVQPQFVERSYNFDNDGGGHTLGVHGMVLGRGDDNRCDSNVVCGQTGLETTNAAYDWEEMQFVSVWIFKGNLAHNCQNGSRIWQNSEDAHVLENTTIYNCYYGGLFGAYQNNYGWKGGIFFNAPFEDHAASSDNGARFENITFDGAGKIPYPFKLIGGPGKGVRPVFMRACTILGGTKGAILDSVDQGVKNLDIIQSSVTGAIKIDAKALSGETIRVQPANSQPNKVAKSGQTNISAFAPTSWGAGTGLFGQYYNGANFNTLATTRIDPVLNYIEWVLIPPGQSTGVHHTIDTTAYSIRWTGFIEPQYSESYKFAAQTGGGVRLYIDGKLLLNNWQEMYPTTLTSSAINLVAGKRYSIKVEYFNNDNHSIFTLGWQSASQSVQLVPQTQLYPGDNVTPPLPPPPPPPVNQAPTANPGQDETINLQLTLNGSGSDPDGSVVAYKWEQVSGPSCNIVAPDKAVTQVNKLQTGTYVFRLTVTDDKGATGIATVTKIIQ
jgi:hypothetical protein